MNVYTFTDSEGKAHQVPYGRDFTSQVQRIDTEEEAAFSLGAELGAYVPCEVQHRQSDLDGYDEKLLARWGITRTVTPDPAPPPPGPRTCSVFEFMYERCTAAERITIRGSTDPHVVDFVEALKVIPQVELDGPLTIAGLAYIESIKLLAPGRAAEIRA